MLRSGEIPASEHPGPLQGVQSSTDYVTGNTASSPANARIHKATQAVPPEHLRDEPLRPVDSQRNVIRPCTAAAAWQGSATLPSRATATRSRGDVGWDVMLRITPDQELQVLREGEIAARHGIGIGRGQSLTRIAMLDRLLHRSTMVNVSPPEQ
jgi:hypothetical protein